MSRERIDFVLGADVNITDLLTSREVLPFLEQGLVAGLHGVQVLDDARQELWSVGSLEGTEVHVARLILEGETVGTLRCIGQNGAPQVAGPIIAGALNVLLFNNLKRKLTTEIHTQVVNLSYDELLAKNCCLEESEQRYRELAEALEVRVAERTGELHQAYNRMLQQEKLASVGQLAAGLAHEINNPLGFILSNFAMLEKYLERIRGLLTFCREQLDGNVPPAFPAEFAARWSGQKLDRILEDSVEMLEQNRIGSERIQKIVSDLRGFSHIDHNDNEPVDINQELERTLNVMAHEIPVDARIVRDFVPLPKFSGNPGLVCQAFFNLLRNAFQCRPLGLQLKLSTRVQEEWLVIIFEDNGPGITAAHLPRIFEPFFTTRDVGQGMGLGLALVYDIVKQAGGTISVDSRVGEGSRFTVTLPLRSQSHVQVR